jgi:hypothetical protein
MKRKKRKPEAAAGYFAIISGALCISIGMFSSLSRDQRYGGAATGLMGLAWGLKEVGAAKRWAQEPEEEHYAKTAEERRESERFEKMEKSGSMQNVFRMFGWVFLFIAVVAIIGLGYLFLFHHRP